MQFQRFRLTLDFYLFISLFSWHYIVAQKHFQVNTQKVIIDIPLKVALFYFFFSVSISSKQYKLLH